MAITTGHFYSALSDASTILLCTDAAGFEFQLLPYGLVQKYNADPTAQLTDLQTLGLSAGVLPVCTMDGEDYQVMEAFSTDATVPNVKVVMIRPQAKSALQDKSSYLCVPVQNVAPVITAIAPASGPAAGGTKVVITGTGFRAMQSSGAVVKFGTTSAAAYTVDSDTQITVPRSPAHAAGAVHITLEAPFANSVNTSADTFTYV